MLIKDEPTVTRLEVGPAAAYTMKPGDAAQLSVKVHFSHGQWRDVTWRTQFVSDDLSVATVTADGRIEAKRAGATAIHIHFQDQVEVALLTIPREHPVDDRLFPPPANAIDEHAFARLKVLRIPPAPLCDDATFLRRAYLDAIGTLPKPEEARAFLSDTRPDKRARLVDELLKDARVARRQSLLKAVDSLAAQVKGDDQIATFDEFHQRAAEMILSPQAQNAFDMSRETDALRDAYGRNPFGQSCLLARRLVEAGVTFTTVTYGGWDHHAKIFESLDTKLPEFDQGFSTFIRDMDERGLLKETLVVCMGEFGRTPKINKDAGQDHWGPAASLLFAGAGVARGGVIGATDKTDSYTTDRPVSPADVACTIYESLGIDPRKPIHTPDGRPLEILDQGATVKELFA